jgi:N-ethylmaleimide reductase
VQNRARFPLEVTEAVIDVWGPARVGYKISPHFACYSMSDSNPIETFSYLSRELSRLGLLYLHITEPIAGPAAAFRQRSSCTRRGRSHAKAMT